MNHKTFFQASGVIFLAVAVIHALRLIYGWSAVINGWNVPQWISVAAVVVGGILSYHAFKFGK